MVYSGQQRKEEHRDVAISLLLGLRRHHNGIPLPRLTATFILMLFARSLFAVLTPQFPAATVAPNCVGHKVQSFRRR
jgi:hypothetical protein